MSLSGDGLFGQYSLNQLFSILKGGCTIPYDLHKTLFLIAQKRLPEEMLVNFDSFESIESYIVLNGPYVRMHGVNHGFTNGSFILLHRDIFFDMQGFDESLGGWGFSDVDIGLRINRLYPVIQLSDMGILVYVLHQSNEARTGLPKNRNENILHDAFSINGTQWGLGGHEFEIQKVKTIKQDKAIGEKSWDNDLVSPDRLKLNAIVEHFDDIRNIYGLVKVLNHRRICEFEGNHAYVYPLVWYLQTRSVKRFMEIGNINSVVPLILTNYSAFTEIYLLDDVSQKEPENTLNTLWSNLRSIDAYRHQANVRLAFGDIENVFGRFISTVGDKIYFDIVIIHLDMLKNVKTIEEISSHLSKGGMMILAGKSYDDLEKINRHLTENKPEFSLITYKKGCIAIYLKQVAIERDISDESMQARLNKTWLPLKRGCGKNLSFTLFLICSTFLEMLRYVSYSRWPEAIWNIAKLGAQDIKHLKRV
jgi:hypothetical protein